MLQRYYQYKGLTINELKEKVHHDLSELGYPDELIDNLLSSLLSESEDKESAENLNNCSSVGDMSKKLHDQLSALGYPDELIDNLLSLELIDNLLSLYSKYLSLYSKYLIALKDKEISEKKNALCNLKDMKKKIQEELCNLNDMKKKIQEELCNPKDSDKLIKDLLSLLPAKKIISDKQIEKAMIPPINRVDTYSSTADGKEVCRFDTYTYNNESLNDLDLQKILNVIDQVYKTSPCKHKPVLTLELSINVASYFSWKEASIAFFDIQSTNADIAIDDALPKSSILDYIKNLAFFDESVFNEYIIKSRTVMKKEIANILKTKHLLTATDKSKVLAKLSKHNIFDNKEIAYRIGIADVSVCRIKNQFLEKIESQAKALDSKCLAYIKALTKKKKEHSNNYAK